MAITYYSARRNLTGDGGYLINIALEEFYREKKKGEKEIYKLMCQ